MNVLKEAKKYIGEVIEVSLLLVALGVVAEILFGSAVPYIGGVVANLVGVVGTLCGNGLAGLIAFGTILYLFHNREKIAA